MKRRKSNREKAEEIAPVFWGVMFIAFVVWLIGELVGMI